MPTDYYATLDVARGARVDEIKKSYRKLAMKWHPDKNLDNPDAQAKFQEISHAYSILSDKQKRDKYDRFGDDEEEPDGDAEMEMFMSMFGQMFAGMSAGGGMVSFGHAVFKMRRPASFL